MEVGRFYSLLDVLYLVYESLGSNIIAKRKKNGIPRGVRHLLLTITRFCFTQLPRMWTFTLGYI